jgi:hypothetical protein
MKDNKAAKKIIKRAKKHPELYTKEEVRYAKIVRKRIKREKKQHEREVSERNSRRGKDDGVRSESEQPKESRQSERSRIARLLYKARSLVRFRTGTHDSRDRND